MMEKALSRGTSLSGESNLSTQELSPRIMGSLEERLIIENDNFTSKNQTPPTLRTPATKKAKRVRFFRNGDKFYTGIVMAVTPERYRSFDSLTTDLTRALLSNVTLPNGVRTIYSMDGKKVQTINDLEDGKCYVVSGHGELFKKVEYSSTKVRRGSSLSGLPQSPAGTGRIVTIIPSCVRARIITLIRHGSKPRKVLRLLINKRNAASLEHVLEAITQTVKLDCGVVKRVYTLSGKLVISLEQFFEAEEVFLAYGSEKSTQEDFELDIEESKCVQSFKRGSCVSKRQSGPMPVMPRKTGKRTLTAPQVRTPSPSTLTLPQPFRMHYNSFLGGEQSTSRCIAASESPQQHRNQQCQPLRVNTSFELNSSKQWSDGDGSITDICQSPVSRHQLWSEDQPKSNQLCDETDKFNGNSFAINNEEPISLSAECLQEISVLTSSMRDLMHNIDDDIVGQKTSKSVTSSLNSILENVNCNKNNNGRYLSPVYNNLHSTNKRNGNSLSDIHSKANTDKISATTSSSSSSTITNDYHRLQPVADKRCNNLSSKKSKNSIYSVSNGAAAGNKRDNDNDKYSSVENFSQSTDGLSVSSDNNIETSDSFVNIQFAKFNKTIGGSSSQSTQSSESLDNIPINRGTKLNSTVIGKKVTEDISRQVLKRNPKYNLRSTANRNSKLIEPASSSVNSRIKNSLIPLRANDQLVADNKPDTSVKSLGSDQVKMREKKAPVVKRDSNKKRFSCFSNYSGKKSQDCEDKLNSARKCSSTDELREDKQVISKINVKANRYSLYYTPQLPRKSYELEANCGKSAGKSCKNSVTLGGASRPTSWKIPESRTDETSDKRNNRKSLVDTYSYSNVKRGNKTARQSVVNLPSSNDGKIK
ncbi:Similar to GG21441: Serine/threonine-protein kinase GG21441 (Drosophila erecta) [Cotesia congregata]|uniref:Similar to GG21441: Serine/threonine-protein kinase GG21441 (Drosophila erecta) n=1 Tax=Cotesia congregata TaxID=51543 RepID=A0A8J2HIV1_COTCN|nr:Similar to GG21441: Serine/threonine-protein kinase GG21441 (Drosophila erecta) [Cotesia congregata]